MKFTFKITEEVNTQAWTKTTQKLEKDLMDLVSGKVSQEVVKEYLLDMIKAMRTVSNENCKDMLFLMFDEPSSMPADARVDFVYRPTYIAATIMMTAMNRFAALRENDLFKGYLRNVLNATMGRNFMGAGWESYAGLMDTLQIFAQGDTLQFIDSHRDEYKEFAALLDTSIQILETEICTGTVKDVWPGTDYRARGKKVLKMLKNKMPNEKEYVWYACYGSIVNRERFMRYIRNCADTTPPVEDRTFVINHSIYFAKHAEIWDGGGKAFLDDTGHGMALGRIYKITVDQFEDVKRQEGHDYTKRIHLGMVDGLPVFSFTDKQKNSPAVTPSEAYFTTILVGLKECYEGVFSEPELVRYLIRSVFPENAFTVASVIKQSVHCLTTSSVCAETGLTSSEVVQAIKWLIDHEVIRQDSRSIRAGHSVDDMQAYFYTVDSACARELLSSMLAAQN